MTGAARLLGVHPNTVRAWTDQGRLRCLRINERGDRRYRVADLEGFLDVAGLQPSVVPFQSRLRPPSSGLVSVQLAAAAGRGGTSRGPRSARGADRDDQPTARPTLEAATGSGLAELAALGSQHLRHGDLEATLRAAARLLRDTGRFGMMAFAERHGTRLAPRLTDGPHRARAWWLAVDQGIAAVCMREGRPIAVSPTGRNDDSVQVFAPIGSGADAWGVIVVESADGRSLGRFDLDLLSAAGSVLALAVRQTSLQQRVESQAARTDAVARIGMELSTRLELSAVMSELVEQTMLLFGADRAAVFRRSPDGLIQAEASHNLSREYLEAIASVPDPSLGSEAIKRQRAIGVADCATEPLCQTALVHIQREGYHSLAVAPLLFDGDVLGLLAVYHDQRHPWSAEDLESLEALAAQASVVIRNARNYEKMATWAAQLQSIQQLGTRLNRLTSVNEIGHAICLELRTLIDYHNVRVYRVYGDDVSPVAWRGEIGEYTDEDSEQLRLVVGEGITGWVAEHGLAQYLPNAQHDPRSATIPGTEADLDESMLLAPMLYEDRVIGVIVLAKLGQDQFTGDDLRYLEIYASIAAQAMASADATELLKAQSERLERQLDGRRELLRMTETILSTLDPTEVMERIIDQVGQLVRADNLGIETYDSEAHQLRPILARGVHTERFMARDPLRDQGVAAWVAAHGSAQLVPDELADPRVVDAEAGAMVVAPLLTRGRVSGVLTLERLGARRDLHRGRIRAHQALRGAGLGRASERPRPPGRGDPRPDRLVDRAQEPGHLPGVPRRGGGTGYAVQPADGGPRRLQVLQRPARPRGRQRAAARHRRCAAGVVPRDRRGLPLRRRRVRAHPAQHRGRGCPRGRRQGRSRRAQLADPRVTSLVRRHLLCGHRDLPGRWCRPRHPAAGSRPRLLRRQARRTRPIRHRRRSAGPCR